MYLDKFEKFGIKQFLNDIFKGASPNAYIVHSQATQPKEFLATCSQLDKLFEEEININEQQNNEGFIGFQTGKGQKIHIDSKKVEKALNFFDEKDLKIDDEVVFFEKDKTNENTNTETFLGFKTANGGKIAIDDKCLKKAESIFDFENDKENIIMNKPKDLPEFSEIKKPLLKNKEKKKERILLPSIKNTSLENEKTNTFNFEGFNGFQTAKGNQIIIDNSKIKEAEKIFLDSDDKTDKIKNNEKKFFEDKIDKKPINTIESVSKKNDRNNLMIQNTGNNKKMNELTHHNNENKKKNVQNANDSSFIKGKFIKSTEKPLFLDFKNKKFKPSKQKDSPEKYKNISASTTSFINVSKNQKNLVKSTEKFNLINPISKRILSEKSEKLYSGNINHEHFIRKGISTKKGIKRDFSNFKNASFSEKPLELKLNFNHNFTNKANEESKNKKEPNQIFNLQAKYLKTVLDKNTIKVQLKDLSIVPDQNANHSFEINETTAINHTFICECMNFSQNSCEKCLCNGKLILTTDFFQKHLQEKFPKIQISEVYTLFKLFKKK